MDHQEELMHRGYVADACEVTKIVFVYKPEDLLHPTCYHKPLMMHQIFTEESIYGYRGLAITIFYLAHSGYCYFDVRYDRSFTINGDPSPHIDDICKLLMPWFPHFTTSLVEIRTILQGENRTDMFGTVVNVFKLKNSEKSIYKVTQCSIEDQAFVLFHQRFESLIIMYIDAANFIDLTDEKWMIFYLYDEKCYSQEDIANYPIGFCTVYKFIKYPDKIRARISQFFIIPPYQRLGLGYKLLDSVYSVLNSMNDVEEITVESPNMMFTHLRDNLDASYLKLLPEYSPAKLIMGYTTEMKNVARARLKLSSQQARRVYHVLRYRVTKAQGFDYEEFKLDYYGYLEQELKRRCHRSPENAEIKKLLLPENANDKRTYFEEKFYKFLLETGTPMST